MYILKKTDNKMINSFIYFSYVALNNLGVTAYTCHLHYSLLQAALDKSIF